MHIRCSSEHSRFLVNVYFTIENSVNITDGFWDITKETCFGRSDNLIDQDKHCLERWFGYIPKAITELKKFHQGVKKNIITCSICFDKSTCKSKVYIW